MKCREATYALFDNIVKQHTHFFDNVAKQHTHFFGMPHPFFETLAMSLHWDVKLLLNKSWPLLFYLWSSDGEAGRGGRILCGWLNVFSRWALFVRKGGSTIFFNPQRGGQAFFLTDSGGGQAFFSHFCDLPQWWNHLSAAWSLNSSKHSKTWSFMNFHAKSEECICTRFSYLFF